MKDDAEVDDGKDKKKNFGSSEAAFGVGFKFNLVNLEGRIGPVLDLVDTVSFDPSDSLRI